MKDLPISAFGDGKGNLRREFAEQILGDVDLILGRDTRTGNEFLVYGRDVLESVIRENRSATVSKVIIALDQSSIELEMLIGLVQAIRGKDDYEASPNLPTDDDVKLYVSDTAKQVLSDDDVSTAVNFALREAVNHKEWKPGKCYRHGLTKAGQRFVVAIDNRVDGLYAWVATPEELVLEPSPIRN